MEYAVWPGQAHMLIIPEPLHHPGGSNSPIIQAWVTCPPALKSVVQSAHLTTLANKRKGVSYQKGGGLYIG